MSALPTPGAWFVDGFEIRATSSARISGTLLASLNRSPVDGAEAKANARAFAASKDLLNVCRAFLEQAGKPENAAHSLGAYMHGAVVQDMRAAIAKAEGRA